MRPQRFVLTAKALHKEVGSWSGVACEITGGKYTYMFRALKQQAQGGDVAKSSRKWLADDQIQPMVHKMEEKMLELRRIIASFESGESNYPTQFQGSTMFSHLITTPLAMKLPTRVSQPSPMATVPKTKKKKVVPSTTTKNLKIVAPTLIINLTAETKHSVSATPIVEEIPAISTCLP